VRKKKRQDDKDALVWRNNLPWAPAANVRDHIKIKGISRQTITPSKEFGGHVSNNAPTPSKLH
jgi:hypothetical protein